MRNPKIDNPQCPTSNHLTYTNEKFPQPLLYTDTGNDHWTHLWTLRLYHNRSGFLFNRTPVPSIEFNPFIPRVHSSNEYIHVFMYHSYS